MAPNQQLNIHLFLLFYLSPLVAVSSPRHLVWLPAENWCPTLDSPLNYQILLCCIWSYILWEVVETYCGSQHTAKISYDYPASGVSLLLTRGYPSTVNINNNKTLKVVSKVLLLNCQWHEELLVKLANCFLNSLYCNVLDISCPWTSDSNLLYS